MKNMRIFALAVASSFALTACATGQGYNDDGGRGQIAAAYYDIPDIDNQQMINGQPVNPAQLETDKNQCASNVAIRPQQAAVNGALTGALLGAALGAALGGRNAGYWAGREAVRGAVVGGVSSGVNASVTQHVALGNCMAGRGYRVLD